MEKIEYKNLVLERLQKVGFVDLPNAHATLKMHGEHCQLYRAVGHKHGIEIVVDQNMVDISDFKEEDEILHLIAERIGYDLEINSLKEISHRLSFNKGLKEEVNLIEKLIKSLSEENDKLKMD